MLPENVVAINQKESNGPAIMSMRVTPWMLEEFKGEPFFLEIEIMKADKIERNGMIETEFVVTDQDKINAVYWFLRMMNIEEIFPPN